MPLYMLCIGLCRLMARPSYCFRTKWLNEFQSSSKPSRTLCTHTYRKLDLSNPVMFWRSKLRRIGPASTSDRSRAARPKIASKICFYQPSGTSQREFSRIPKIVKRVIKSERRNINHLIFRLKPNRILIFESIIEAKKITNFIIWFPFRR